MDPLANCSLARVISEGMFSHSSDAHVTYRYESKPFKSSYSGEEIAGSHVWMFMPKIDPSIHPRF